MTVVICRMCVEAGHRHGSLAPLSQISTTYPAPLPSPQQTDKEKLSRHNSTSSRASLEAKVMHLDSAMDELSQRNAFSAYCIWQETKLVKVSMPRAHTRLHPSP